MNLKLFIISYSLCIIHFSYAQDIHFTQFRNNPLYLNPALSGVFDGSIRMVGSYKNQWANIPVPYNTAALSADFQAVQLRKNQDILGAGILLFADQAGDARFTTSSANIQIAYHKTLGLKKNSLISIGANVGVGFKSFSPQYLRFDNQFNGDFFDPSLPSDENYTATRIFYPDFGTGINFRHRSSGRTYYNFGMSVQHLNKPNQSFYNNREVLLSPRWVAYTDNQIYVSEKLDIKPEFLFQWQDGKYEIVPGILFQYYAKNEKGNKLLFSGGVYGRIQDAATPVFEVQYNQWRGGFSYDINVSKFAQVTRSNGGFELSIQHTFKSKKQPVRYDLCPFF